MCSMDGNTYFHLLKDWLLLLCPLPSCQVRYLSVILSLALTRSHPGCQSDLWITCPLIFPPLSAPWVFTSVFKLFYGKVSMPKLDLVFFLHPGCFSFRLPHLGESNYHPPSGKPGYYLCNIPFSHPHSRYSSPTDFIF